MARLGSSRRPPFTALVSVLSNDHRQLEKTGELTVQQWTSPRAPDARQYAPAAERNAGPILTVLGPHLPPVGTILEIGSGTGQHVIAFAAAQLNLSWLPSDPDPAARASIDSWTAAANLANVRAPLDIDVTAEDWARSLDRPLQGVVCINLLHIAPWAACAGLMAGAGRLLERGAPLYIYGPFKQGGRHTAPSNVQFDRYLRMYDPAWGVRDLEAVVGCAADHGLDFIGQEAMPANNLSVILRRR
ncbi:MAG TPA: DUF938 domain-containing protein [Geminicoccaceae bacterium]|jgi:hypothetical protein|nr:DUF938 domain-containing protein [Geminicoccaceae bacterium]